MIYDRINEALNNWLDYRGWVPPTLPERIEHALRRRGLRTFKVGGLRFVQVHRLSVSFCLRKRRCINR